MAVAYQSEKGVFFDPNEVDVDRCLKCAVATRRRSPRTIAVLARGYAGRRVVRSMKGALVLCEACDRRWSVGVLVGLLGFAMPFAFPAAAVFVHLRVTPLSFGLMPLSFVLGLVAALGMYLFALKRSIRVRGIDDDGLIGLGGVHPEVAGDIVVRGMEV